MKARVLYCVVALAPLIAAGCATQSDVTRPGDRTFSQETQPPGSAVAQGPVVLAPPQQAVVVAPAPPQVVSSTGQPVVVQSGQPAGTVVPGTSGVVTTVAPQMIQADDLEANEVRAQTIYANRIQAPEIQGTIHQTGGVRFDHAVNDVKAAMVSATVVYADTIKADRVIANQIYVRELARR